MVKVAEGAWRGRAFVALLATAAMANACGGRTVWVDEGADSGESGGVSGRGGDYGGGSAGDYGGGGVTGGYGGTYGGTYGGAGYTGGVSGDYGGGGVTGGYGGTYGGAGFTGGVAGKGGFGGSAGVAGMPGCGAVSGSGGSSGSPALGKACSYFCTRFPYSSCSTDLEGPADCIAQCQTGFGLGGWCEAPLADFLICAGIVLDPAATCNEQGGNACAGPGCLSDAMSSCGFEYDALLKCEASPRPLPPCPPPPDPPLPPGCSLEAGYGDGVCQRNTYCTSGVTLMTKCLYRFDPDAAWDCECSANGSGIGSVTLNPATTADPCQQAASICGFY